MIQLSSEREKELETLQQNLNISFQNITLLNQALTHSSSGHENNLPDNERMEFLGDAVLKLIVTEYIYNKFPQLAEGALTKIRASVISDETLGNIGKKMGLGEVILLSQNEKKSGGRKRKSNVANAFEALIGAVFLDAGLGKVRDLIIGNLNDEIELVSQAGYIGDYKSALQEYVQKKKWELPRYKVIKETGPEHRRVFWVEVKIKGKRYGIGRGANKKEAEQRAATVALKVIKAPEKHSSTSGKESDKKGVSGIREIISNVKKRMKF
ncbi:MAG: ribonuclease III [Candidatus Margulisiibacteriota bacterium]